MSTGSAASSTFLMRRASGRDYALYIYLIFIVTPKNDISISGCFKPAMQFYH